MKFELERALRRSRHIYTAITVLEVAAETLESVSAVDELRPDIRRWCRSIRSKSQKIVKEFDACELEIIRLYNAKEKSK